MKKNIIVGILLIILEIFIVNYSSVRSIFYKEKEITNYKYYNFVEKDNEYLTDLKTSYVEFKLDEKVNNIYLDIESSDKNVLNVKLDYTDDANSKYSKYKTNNDEYIREIHKDVELSKYINCYHLGNTKSIKLIFVDEPYTKININEIVINKKVPFHIHYIRLIFIYLIYFIINNYFSNKKFKEYIESHKKLILTIIIVLFSILTIILYKNISNMEIKYDHYTNEYVDSLMNGRLSLNIPNFNRWAIKNKDINIYDYSVREGMFYGFDTSFYNNTLYMYFSPLPAIIMGLTKLNVY